ncbi:MAG: flagellar filament capping protein FliD [Oligoflexia bacterium]|nr:flagellar filament capping protein FliD [Oligoflexia bacterium]
MAGISLGPIASGLPKDLVQRLVEAEREPIRQLESRKQNEEAKLELANDLSKKVGDITSKIADLTRFRNFRDLMAEVGRPELMDVTVDKNQAEPGSYQIEVVQMAGHSSMISNGFEDKDETQIGAGYFSYTLPSGEVKEVYIDPENSTLEGIAKIINNQRDLNLSAIVVDDGIGSENPYRIIVSHKGTGEINDAEFPEFYFLDGDEDFYLEKEKMAQNSLIKVNGFDVEFEGNSITSLLPGVSIDLKDVAPGKEFTLQIKEDTQSVRGKIEAMVGTLNDVLGFIQKQNTLDKDSNTRSTLGGDITLQTLEYKIRNLVITPLATEFGNVRMADIGVQFNRQGLLDFNGERFESALKENFDAVAQFFVGLEDGGDGFASQLDSFSKNMIRQQGVVSSRVDGIKRRIRDIDRQIEMKERQIANTERNLKEKFAKLEGTVAKLKAQQASVQGALGGGSLLPNLG